MEIVINRCGVINLVLKGIKVVAVLNFCTSLDQYQYGGNDIFCERPRLKPFGDWHREPASTQGRRFSWRHFLYNEALINAARDSNTEVAKHLIESDVCNVNAQNTHGYTALIFAALYGHTEAVRLILQKDRSGIDVHDVGYKMTALMYACIRGRAAVIELLIRAVPTLTSKTKTTKQLFNSLMKRVVIYPKQRRLA